jgi:hypothetical protein
MMNETTKKYKNLTLKERERASVDLLREIIDEIDDAVKKKGHMDTQSLVISFPMITKLILSIKGYVTDDEFEFFTKVASKVGFQKESKQVVENFSSLQVNISESLTDIVKQLIEYAPNIKRNLYEHLINAASIKGEIYDEEYEIINQFKQDPVASKSNNEVSHSSKETPKKKTNQVYPSDKSLKLDSEQNLKRQENGDYRYQYEYDVLDFEPVINENVLVLERYGDEYRHRTMDFLKPYNSIFRAHVYFMVEDTPNISSFEVIETQIVGGSNASWSPGFSVDSGNANYLTDVWFNEVESQIKINGKKFELKALFASTYAFGFEISYKIHHIVRRSNRDFIRVTFESVAEMRKPEETYNYIHICKDCGHHSKIKHYLEIREDDDYVETMNIVFPDLDFESEPVEVTDLSYEGIYVDLECESCYSSESIDLMNPNVLYKKISY